MKQFYTMSCNYNSYINHDEFVFYATKPPMGLDIPFLLSKKKVEDKLSSNHSMIHDIIRNIGNISHIILENNKRLSDNVTNNKASAGEYVLQHLCTPNYLCGESRSYIYIVRDFENTWFITPTIHAHGNKNIYPDDVFTPINYDKYLVMNADTLEVIDATV